MADETNTDRPLDRLSETEQRLDGDNRPSSKQTDIPQPDKGDERIPAAARLRAFEDEHFGEDAVRIDGKVERGSGSPYQAMSEPRKRHYQALEKAMEAEVKLGAARSQMAIAENEMVAAEADIERAEADAEKDESEDTDGRE